MKTSIHFLAAVLLLLVTSAGAATLSTVNIGSAANDGTGDTLRTGGGKINTNFTILNAVKLENTNGVAYGLILRGSTNAFTFTNGAIAGYVLTTDGTNWFAAAAAAGGGTGASTNEVLTNIINTVGRNVTNVVSLSTTNATSKPLTNAYASGVLTLFGLEAGGNVTITPNGSNLVIAATVSGSGIETNGNQFGASVPVTLKTGLFTTNLFNFGTLSNSQGIWIGANGLGVANGGVDVTGTALFRNEVQVTGGLGVDMGIIAQSNVMFFAGTGTLMTNELQLYQNTIARFASTTTHAGTNVVSGVLRLPAIATNTLLFLGGQSNTVGLGVGANLAVVSGNLTASASPTNAALTNLINTVGRNVTNVVSLSTTNATSKPLTNAYASGVLTLYGLEAGGNVTITPNASNLVIAASVSGSGIETNGTQFGASLPVTLKTGLFTTNLFNFGTLSNSQGIWIGANGLGVANGGVDVTGTSLFRNEVQVTGGLGVDMGIIAQSNVMFFAGTGTLMTNELQLYQNTIARFASTTTHAGTNVVSGVLRLPAIATNTLLFLGGQSNTIGLTLGSGLSVSAGALTASGSGGTNYPPVIRIGTNVTVASGVRQSLTLQTNASFALVFTGTPLNGEEIQLGVSNIASSTIYLTNTAGIYDYSVASNVTTFPIAGTSVRWFTFVSSTNFNLGVARWELRSSFGKEAEIAVAGSNGVPFLTLSTNAAGSIITWSNTYVPMPTNLALANLQGLASTVFTNVPLGGTNISVRTTGGTNFYDTTGQLNNWSQFTTNVWNSRQGGSAVLTNLSGVDQTFTNAFTRTATTVSGAGNGSTNYLLTISTNSLNDFHLGSSNVHIYTVSGGTLTQPIYWNAYVTNLSANTWGINFASGTNRWRFSGVYGTNAPSVLTNGTLLQLSGRSDGTNTIVGYTYYAPGL